MPVACCKVSPGQANCKSLLHTTFRAPPGSPIVGKHDEATAQDKSTTERRSVPRALFPAVCQL